MVGAENGSRWRMVGAGPRASAVMNFGFGGARGTSVPADDLIFLFTVSFLGLSSLVLPVLSSAFVLRTCAWVGFTFLALMHQDLVLLCSPS